MTMPEYNLYQIIRGIKKQPIQYIRHISCANNITDIASELYYQMIHHHKKGYDLAVVNEDRDKPTIFGNSGKGGGDIYIRRTDGSLNHLSLAQLKVWLHLSDKYEDMVGVSNDERKVYNSRRDKMIVYNAVLDHDYNPIRRIIARKQSHYEKMIERNRGGKR